MPTQFTFIRHGETDWNTQQRWQGWRDVPLNALGRAQAAEAAPQLRHETFSRLVSSPLSRANETAQILGRALGLNVETDERLREIHIGDCEGMTTAEVAQAYPHLMVEEKQPIAYWERPFPNGESRRQHLHRLENALRDLAGQNKGGHVLVVTHGGCMRVIMMGLAGWSEIARIANCGILKLRLEENQWIADSGQPYQTTSLRQDG